MDTVLVVVGLALNTLGYGGERAQPPGFNRGRVVGMVLFVIGEILLFGVGWWWGLLGLAIPPLLIDVVLGAIRRR